ncbi:MAG: DsbA family protein [Candidatus Obscuribacterales bacterium]|nr:DsbA family protein [Candidatus Obscuribacterales bacterium]
MTLLTVSASSSLASAESNSVTARLTVFTDYQCSTCRRFESTLDRARAKYGASLSVDFKNFPLRRHKNATKAAYAAESSARQGKLRQMQDKLFRGQAEWAYSSDPSAKFVDYARSLNMDADKFTADMDSSGVKETVDADIRIGKSLGVHETPTVLARGKIYAGSALANLDGIIDDSKE